MLASLIQGHNIIPRVSSIELSFVRVRSPTLVGFDQHLILRWISFHHQFLFSPSSRLVLAHMENRTKRDLLQIRTVTLALLGEEDRPVIGNHPWLFSNFRFELKRGLALPSNLLLSFTPR